MSRFRIDWFTWKLIVSFSPAERAALSWRTHQGSVHLNTLNSVEILKRSKPLTVCWVWCFHKKKKSIISLHLKMSQVGLETKLLFLSHTHTHTHLLAELRGNPRSMGCYCSESGARLQDPKQDVPEELLRVTAPSSSEARSAPDRTHSDCTISLCLSWLRVLFFFFPGHSSLISSGKSWGI